MEAKEAIDKKFSALSTIDSDRIDDARDQLLGIEGTASEIYWNAILIIPPDYLFSGRRGDQGPRFAQDIVNAMLNYGYAILHAECLKARRLSSCRQVGENLYSVRSHVVLQTADCG